jgi:geranylgeranyl diphosphate synthase, type I
MTTAAPAILGRTRRAILPAMQAAVARLGPQLRRPVEYHLGWLDLDGRPVERDGGKSVRAGLALLSAAAAGADEAIGVPGAVAIELVHNFSLIHDDLMDDDRERRHRPTVWAVFGPATAIIAGDALAALAVQVVLEQPGQPARDAAAALQESTARMIAGQADDLALEQEADPSIEACMAMAAGKTGALMSCAASIGAILAGAPSTQVVALAEFGELLGLAFQAVDDVLGIWGEPDVTGKPAGNDIRRAKKSIPICVALERDASGELAALLEEPDLRDADVARAAALIDELGGRAFTEDAASSSLAAAYAALARAAVAADVGAELEHVARFVVGRDR